MELARKGSLPEAVAAFITEERCKRTLVELVRIPSPQTDLLEQEPQLKAFIATAVEPRLRAMGIDAIRYDAFGNLIAEIGERTSGRSLMLITNAMNQPQSTMTNAYAGDVADGTPYELPGEVVFGKGASEQKSVMAAMLVSLEALLASGIAITGRLVFVCCLSGESGRHDAIRSVVEGEGVRTDIAVLGGQSLKLSLGNRGRIDVFITVRGKPAHSSKPHEACDAVTGATKFIAMLREDIDLTREHADLGRATMAITRFESFPHSTHTIQDRVELTIDRRLLPGESPDEAFAEIARSAKRLEAMTDPASGLPWSVEVELGPFMYPSQIAAGSAAARLISESMHDVIGEEPEHYFTTQA
ncbi:MAG: acetylornithine deacetylase/succinyldiaminopimelate desuccinylase-like deacylase, partial [Hyphomicrobiales bacterium]|nr:acetylornithine deacetylase/succinyldiaminopimelate desuccinylase-like deacylase [Hyphomicrobiales bacterium]